MTTGFGFCATCGTPRLAADQKFCAVCGSALAPMAPPAPAPVAPPPAPPAPVVVAPAPTPAPTFAEAAAAPAPQVEAAIPAPPAPGTSESEAPAAPPWATSAVPPAPERAPAVVESAPAPVAPPPPPPPPVWSVPPAVNQGATAPPAASPAWSQPPAPPAYQAAPPYQPTPSYQAAPVTPGAPAAARTGFKITPPILLIGVVVVAAIVGGLIYMNMSSSSGGLTFTPSTISCSKPVAFTTTVRLPSSVKATDKISITLDGKSLETSTVSDVSDIVHQQDGTWTSTSATTLEMVQTMCAAGGSAGGINVLTPGTHTMQFLDSTGTKVLASGSYTVTP